MLRLFRKAGASKASYESVISFGSALDMKASNMAASGSFAKATLLLPQAKPSCALRRRFLVSGMPTQEDCPLC